MKIECSCELVKSVSSKECVFSCFPAKILEKLIHPKIPLPNKKRRSFGRVSVCRVNSPFSNEKIGKARGGVVKNVCTLNWTDWQTLVWFSQQGKFRKCFFVKQVLFLYYLVMAAAVNIVGTAQPFRIVVFLYPTLNVPISLLCLG